MATKQYNVTTVAKARSRGKDAPEGGSNSVTNITGAMSSPQLGDGHTHDNKVLLDALRYDENFYLYIREKIADADEATLNKIKAGLSDDAVKWMDHEWEDYMNQPVRSTDIVEFAKVISDLMHSSDFVSGMETGAGWGITQSAVLEVNGLISRSYIKTPKLIYNKVHVTGGEMWNTEGGTIKSVTPDPGSETAFTLVLDIEPGDVIELDVDDICKGHYNSDGGFITSYFRVTNVDTAANSIRVVLGADDDVPGGLNAAPVPNMNIARYGNFNDLKAKRQRSQYFSSSELRIVLLGGVNSYKITSANYRGVFGTVPDGLIPDNLPVEAGDVSFYGKYGLFEKIFQVDVNGDIIRTIRDRGIWSPVVAAGNDPYLCNEYEQHEVYHQNCKYRCISNGTTDEPAYDSTSWLLVAGDTTLMMAIGSSNGETFLQGCLETTLTARVKRGVTDITAQILTTDWSWKRDTGNTVADAAWNANHALCGNTCHITDDDMNGTHGTFECTAFVRDGAQTIYDTVDF